MPLIGQNISLQNGKRSSPAPHPTEDWFPNYINTSKNLIKINQIAKFKKKGLLHKQPLSQKTNKQKNGVQI